MIVVGIDPGFSGAIAVVDAGRLVEVHDMPTLASPKGRTELDHLSLLGILRMVEERSRGGAVVWLEQVAAMPGQGVSSVFRFGQTYGAIECAVMSVHLPLRHVTAPVWKRALGLTADKGVCRRAAILRYPDAAQAFARVKDDGRAEAALIAAYGAQRLVGEGRVE